MLRISARLVGHRLFLPARRPKTYVKLLAARQEDSKNRIYLGGGVEGVTKVITATILVLPAREGQVKRKSIAVAPELEVKLDFALLQASKLDC